MESREFQKCCQAVEEGEEIYLENTENGENGRLLYCTGDQFQVQVEGERKMWGSQTCEEIGSSSEKP